MWIRGDGEGGGVNKWKCEEWRCEQVEVWEWRCEQVEVCGVKVRTGGGG